MVGYEIRIEGMEQQLSKLAQYPQISERHLTAAMQKSVITVESAIKLEWPVGVTGRSRNAIASEVKREGLLSIVGKVGSTLEDEVYPKVIEFGRKAGAAMPPYGEGSPLARWVHIVMGDAVSVFVVARAIAAKGIKSKKPFKKGWDKSQAKVLDFFAQALANIAKDLENGRK